MMRQTTEKESEETVSSLPDPYLPVSDGQTGSSDDRNNVLGKVRKYGLNIHRAGSAGLQSARAMRRLPGVQDQSVPAKAVVWVISNTCGDLAEYMRTEDHQNMCGPEYRCGRTFVG
jgi:hypothetical protein